MHIIITLLTYILYYTDNYKTYLVKHWQVYTIENLNNIAWATKPHISFGALWKSNTIKVLLHKAWVIKDGVFRIIYYWTVTTSIIPRGVYILFWCPQLETLLSMHHGWNTFGNSKRQDSHLISMMPTLCQVWSPLLLLWWFIHINGICYFLAPQTIVASL